MKSSVLQRIIDVGVIPAVRTSNAENAVRTAEAILQGGVNVVEISLASQVGLNVLDAVATALSQSMLIGAGTVVDGEGVRQAALAGARFVVTPGFCRDAVAKAKEFGLAIFAGALTPTEVQSASASGADAVKLFPCYSMGGVRYLRSLLGQYPNIDFIASGGVGLENCAEYIRAGACAIGVGGEIADSDSISLGDFRVFTIRSKRLREAIRNARTLMEETVTLNVGEAR